VGHENHLIGGVVLVPEILEMLSKKLCGQLLRPPVIERANTADWGVGPVQKRDEFMTTVSRGGSQGCMDMVVDEAFLKGENVGRAKDNVRERHWDGVLNQ
jgi:hypothetical protein